MALRTSGFLVRGEFRGTLVGVGFPSNSKRVKGYSGLLSLFIPLALNPCVALFAWQTSCNNIRIRFILHSLCLCICAFVCVWVCVCVRACVRVLRLVQT